MTGPLTDALAWTVVGLFGAGAVLEATDRRDPARLVASGAWVAFGAFWLVLVPHFAVEQRSIVEGLLSLLAVPACLYTGRALYRGRDSLFVLSRSVAVMGVVYLPATTVEAVRRPLVEWTAGNTGALIRALGHDPALVRGSELGYQNMFLFTTNGLAYPTEVVLACTGLGSISIFVGLTAALDAPLSRKLRALAVVVPVIYVLNVVRIAFIAMAYGNQWFADQGWVLVLFGVDNPHLASYLLADRVISQGLSVVVLVAIALGMVRILPELLVVFEDVLYLATGDEHDLRTAVGADAGVRPDGGARGDDGLSPDGGARGEGGEATAGDGAAAPSGDDGER